MALLRNFAGLMRRGVSPRGWPVLLGRDAHLRCVNAVGQDTKPSTTGFFASTFRMADGSGGALRTVDGDGETKCGPCDWH